MPKLVELPTGEVAEFPDEMGDDEILSVLRQKFPPIQDPYAPTQDPYADDSPWDFSGERTIGGALNEAGSALQREFLGSFSTGLRGTAEIADAATNLIGLEGLIDQGEENPLVRGANAFDEWLYKESAAKIDPKYADLFTTKAAGAVGSIASFLTPTGILRGASWINRGRKALEGAEAIGKLTRAEKIASGAFAASIGAGEQAQRIDAARASGLDVSEGREDLSTFLGAGVGLTEMIPLGRMFGRTNQAISRGRSAGIAFLEEGTQEWGSGLLQNAIETGYNPNADILDGSQFDDFTIGGGAGALVDFALNTVAGRRALRISERQKEGERKYREAEEASYARYRQNMADIEAAKNDPEAFAALGVKVRQSAPTVEPPSQEEVQYFNSQSPLGPTATPNAFGELYAYRVLGKLGPHFPTNTAFGVTKEGDTYTVRDASGNQYGQQLTDERSAIAFARNLNKNIARSEINQSILETLKTAPEGYSEQDSELLFRYGYRSLSPEANRISTTALDEAAGTTSENGYDEELSLDQLATAQKLGDKRYGVQMPDGSTKYISGLTASQELNLKRLNEGLPQTNSFNINEVRQYLGGSVKGLSNPVINGTMDTAQYGGVVIDNKPVVVSNNGEVISSRKVTEAEKTRAGKDEDGNDVLPDYIDFQSLDEAKRYAGRLNQRAPKNKTIPTELFDGKDDLTGDIKRLLDAKNIASETNSPEIKQLVNAFTGAESFGDMDLDDQKLFYARLRELPALTKKAKLPLFRQRAFKPEQMAIAAKLENAKGSSVTKQELSEALNLPVDDPAVDGILNELAMQNIRRSGKELIQRRDIDPIESALKKVLKQFNVDPNLLKVQFSDVDETGQRFNGYFDPRIQNLVLSINAIDESGTMTDEQRTNALKGILTHETIHVLRYLDMFTMKEWAILENAVARTKVPGQNITFLQQARQKYGDQSAVIQVEEAIAELAREYIENKSVINGKPRSLIERIIKFFKSMRNLMDGYGFNTFEDVLTAVSTGEVGARQRGEVRTLRGLEEQQAKLEGIVPERYAPFVGEFRRPTLGETRRERPEAQPQQGAGRLADFDVTQLEGADVRQSRRYAVKEIEKLTDSRGSLKNFAQQFADRIKQADRTLEDADRIAKGYIKEFVENPSSFLPVVTGDKLDVDSFLRMRDGTLYDPNKLEHADATDQTIRIYNAVQNGTIGAALEREAQALNKQRAEDLSNLSEYLNENAAYSLAEQALIMRGASKYGARYDKNRGLVLVPIADNNRTSVAVITAMEASSVAEELRKGKSLKDAMLSGIENAIESKKKSNKADGFTGWKTFKKSDAEEDAAALKDGCAGREWCTATSSTTARNYLGQGDFHIYYKSGEPIVALRTEDGKLAEPPRGSLPKQFMTPEEEKIAEEALRAGRVEGGEDYLHDRDLIADVMAGRHKDWSDIDLFKKRKRKYELGYGGGGYDLPASVLNQIQKEIDKREPDNGWESVGIIDGDYRYRHDPNSPMPIILKYVTGDVSVFNESLQEDLLSQKMELFDLEAENRGIDLEELFNSDYRVYGNELEGNPEITIDEVGGDIYASLGIINVKKVVGELHLDGNGVYATIGEAKWADIQDDAYLKINKLETADVSGNSILFAKNVKRVFARESFVYSDEIGFLRIENNVTVYANIIKDIDTYYKSKNNKLYANYLYASNKGYPFEVNNIDLNVKNAYGPIDIADSNASIENMYGTLFVGKFSNIKVGETHTNNEYVDGNENFINAFKEGNVQVTINSESYIMVSKLNGRAFLDKGNNPIRVNQTIDEKNVEIVQEPIVVEMPESFYEGMDKIKEAFPETGGRRYSRKSSQSPIEDAVKLAQEKYADYSTRSSKEFFSHWNKLLSKVGNQLQPTPSSIRIAAKKSITDMAKFLKENPRFADYYESDMKAVRKALENEFGKITDSELELYQTFNGLTSPNTKLKSNVRDAVNLFTIYKQDGNLDSIRLGESAKGNVVLAYSPLSISGTSAGNKARAVKIIDRLIKEKGSIKKAMDFLRESVTSKQLNEFKRDMGYKSNVGGIGSIRSLVQTATGQDKLIPRMFIFGKKVGAYTLNLTGDHKYTTIDIWESRFIRSYFDGLFKKNTGLPVGKFEHDLFTTFNEVFKEEFDKRTGKDWEPSSLQAMRWFYILNSANKAGYKGASTNDTISEYTKQAIDSSGRTRDGGRRPRDGAGISDGRRYARRDNRFAAPALVAFIRPNRASDGTASVPYARGSGTYGGTVRILNNDVAVENRYIPSQEFSDIVLSLGQEAKPFYQLVSGTNSANTFHQAISEFKSSPENIYSAAVHVYPVEDYANMRLFLTESGKTGFALKDDGDIISVFSNEKGGRSAMELAIQSGGRKLDCFDTILPDFYASHLFSEAGRVKWDDKEAPPDWDKAVFAKFNKGEPDVVMMVYDPAGVRVDDEEKAPTMSYGEALDAQEQLMSELSPPADDGIMPTTDASFKEGRSTEVLRQAVEAAQKDTEDTGRFAVPLYNPEASPDALYVAQNPEMAETPSDDDKRRYSRRNTPEFGQKAKDIMDRVTPQMPDETLGETILKKMELPPIRDMADKFRKNFINRYARLERQYRENPELKALLADTSSMAMSEMSDHARQFTQRALVYGIPVYENGMVKVKDFIHKGKKYRGLIEVMAMLHTKEYGNLEPLAHAYATAVRGERLNNEGKLSPVKPGELKILEEEVNKFINPATGQPIIKEWFETWQSYNSNIVKFLKDTGVIDEAGAELWLKQSDYVPFYREDSEGNLQFPRVFGGLHTAGQFKAVGKSDKALNVDMITAITGNIDAAISMGMKNVAQQRIIRDQINLGLASLLKPGESVGNRNSVSFKVAGKRYTAIIEDPLIYESMLPVTEIPLDGLFGSMFRIPASWLRELIIREPGYMVANMFRDTLSSYVITGAQITPFVDTARNVFADLTKLENLGVVGGYDLRIDRDGVKDFYKKQSKLMGMKGGIDWTNPFMAAWDGLGRLSTRSEAATRLAVYNDVLARTGNEAEAQYQALSVMNYGRRGGNPFFRALTAVVPFLNARAQGLDKLWQATFGRVGAKYETDAQGNVTRNLSNFKNFQRYLMRAGLIMGISALYYAMMHDDDEYKNATPEVRDNYYIIPIKKGDVAAGEPGLSVRLPIPFEVGILFKVMPERFLAATFGTDTPRDIQQSFFRNLTSTMQVTPPQAIAPLIEVGINRDFYTGRPVVPTYMQNLLPEQQTTFYTNKFVEDIANFFGYPPMKLEHLAQGYGGSLGAYLLQAVDSAWRSGAERKPSLPWYQYPVVKRFFATANQPGLQSQFYDLKDYMDGITKTINDLEERGQYDELAAFYAKNGHLYEMRSTVNYMNRYITRLRDQRKMIEQMDIDPESKRKLVDEINMQIAASLTSVPMLRQQAFGPRPEEEQ